MNVPDVDRTMPGRVLVAYATRGGSTRAAAEAVAAELRARGLEVSLTPAAEVRGLGDHGLVVLGTALYMGRWHRDVRGFLARHRGELAGREVALFVLGPVRSPRDDGEWLNAQDQTDKELARFPWLRPVAARLFGGRFDPATLPFPFNRLAAKEPASDALDLAAVRAWAGELVGKVGTEPVAEPFPS